MGWDELKNILDDNRRVYQTADRESGGGPFKPPNVCPICGTQLNIRQTRQTSVTGSTIFRSDLGVQRDCPVGDYQWP